MFSLIPWLTLITLTVNIQAKSPNTGKIGIDQCSAVYVGENEALTAAHCMMDSTGKLWVRNSDGKSFSAEIIKTDKYMDLCLIRILGPKHAYVKLGSLVEKGQSIYVMSTASGMAYTYNEGIVQNVLIDDDTHILSVVHSASILHGSSGSGLFNRWGRLIGINTAIQGPISYATDGAVIKGFLGVR